MVIITWNSKETYDERAFDSVPIITFHAFSSLMIPQHWYSKWPGSVRRHAIISLLLTKNNAALGKRQHVAALLLALAYGSLAFVQLMAWYWQKTR